MLHKTAHILLTKTSNCSFFVLFFVVKTIYALRPESFCPLKFPFGKFWLLYDCLCKFGRKKGQSSIKVYLCLQLTDSRIVETWMPWPFLNTLFRCQSCYQLFTATKTGTSFKLSKLSTSSNSCQSCQQLVSAVQYRSTDLLGMVRARIEKCSDGCADCWKLNAVGFSTAFGS